MSAELPTGYFARAPQERDAAAVAEVVTALDIADYGEPDFTEQDLLDDWMRPRFQLADDAWVLIGPTGRIIGYAYVWESEPDLELSADAYVLPEYAGRGLGGQLLDLIEGRARAMCSGRSLTLGMFASGANEEKRNLLERRGFVFVRSVLRMRIDLARERVEPVVTADDVVIGPLDANDVDKVRAVWLDAFAAHGRFSSRSMDEWLASRFEHPAFDPSLWRVATVDGEVVGGISVFDVGATGYTSTVAVRAASRGKGIGPGLVRAAFDALRDRGQMRVLVSLDADDDAGLLGMYEAAGMRVHERHDLFVKAI
jgi:mycothiol synthase